MKARASNPLLLLGLIGTLTFGATFLVYGYRAFLGRSDIWWTPKKMALSIEETKDDFEILIAGELFRERIAERTLLLVGPNGAYYPVTPGDVKVRLNNWNKVRAKFLATTTATGLGLGAAVALLAVGLRQRVAAGAAAG